MQKKTLSITPNSTHAEAPRSATTNVRSTNGFTYLFTMREATGGELLRDIEAFEKVVLEKGWTPVENKRISGGLFDKPTVPTKKCETHSLEMKEKVSKKPPYNKYFSHWEGVYPNLGRQCFGQGYQENDY